MKSVVSKIAFVAMFMVSASAVAFAQDTPPDAGGPPRPGMGQAASGDPQPYDKVITKDAKTKKGLVTVHQVKDKYFYEIPKDLLNKELLWVAQIKKATLGVDFGGAPLGNRVVRWERIDNKVHLRSINYRITADPSKPIAEAVAASNNDTIIMTFPVAANGPGESTVIDVGRLFTTDVSELSARQRLSATALDTSRSFIERVSAFPENVNVVVTHTYTRTAPPGGSPFGAAQQTGGMSPGSASVVLHHSMVKLPENPMMPRLFDRRVGYFSVNTVDFGSDAQKAETVTYITRWRLEKKDPKAALSEPVKPIVYHIDSSTPTWLVPYVKKGVEKWQKAFEAAGFKNAIIAKMAPTAKEDPDFSPEDARYSVIRWIASSTENARGPNVNDPRTGEILESDIEMYHNIKNLLRSWYFIQVGPLDKRAQKLPLPDELMGDLVEYVVAHEVGHTLGFQHNMKSSSTYTVDQVRNREWVKKMGHVATLMDYSRYNYVAQPEDNIDVADLIPGIGPYDEWATMWGYKPIEGAKTPEAETATLDSWARQQDTTPWLRFSTQGSMGSDPGELTEAVGDADAVKATTLGLKNLERVAKMLFSATTTEKGAPYEDLNLMYGRMLGQWSLEMNHVAAIVGGFDTRQKHVGQDGLSFIPVAKARQQEAVKFLLDNAFTAPTWAVDKEIIRRLEPVGTLNRFRNAQNNVLSNLLSSTRFARLVETQALDGGSAYAAADFVSDVRGGVFSELSGTKVSVDAYRRNLHRSFLDIANTKINGSGPSAQQAAMAALFGTPMITSGDERSIYRAELRRLSASIRASLPKATDKTTRAHLEGMLDQIGEILNPESGRASASSNSSFVEFQKLMNSDHCWVDYVVNP